MVQRSYASGSSDVSLIGQTIGEMLHEIAAKYHFGIKQGIQMFIFAAITAILGSVVFQFDREILSFLSREGFHSRVLATVCILAFVPFFAYSYSTVTRLLLKMIKLD